MVKFFEPDKGIVHTAKTANQIPSEVIKRSIEIKPVPVNVKEGIMPKPRRRTGFVADANSPVHTQIPIFFSKTDHTLHAGSFDVTHSSNKDLVQVNLTTSYP